DDPKTYTRPISNDRVFVLTPNVEVMEYSCMEGNIQALLEGVLTAWTGSKDSDKNLIYDAQHDWPAYDLTKSQKLTGVIREANDTGPPPSLKMEIDKKVVTVLLAPAPRMEFRGLTDLMLKPGVTVTVSAVPSKQAKDEFRAETITIDGKTTELR